MTQIIRISTTRIATISIAHRLTLALLCAMVGHCLSFAQSESVFLDRGTTLSSDLEGLQWLHVEARSGWFPSQEERLWEAKCVVYESAMLAPGTVVTLQLPFVQLSQKRDDIEPPPALEPSVHYSVIGYLSEGDPHSLPDGGNHVRKWQPASDDLPSVAVLAVFRSDEYKPIDPALPDYQRFLMMLNAIAQSASDTEKEAIADYLVSSDWGRIRKPTDWLVSTWSADWIAAATTASSYARAKMLFLALIWGIEGVERDYALALHASRLTPEAFEGDGQYFIQSTYPRLEAPSPELVATALQGSTTEIRQLALKTITDMTNDDRLRLLIHSMGQPLNERMEVFRAIGAHRNFSDAPGPQEGWGPAGSGGDRVILNEAAIRLWWRNRLGGG